MLVLMIICYALEMVQPATCRKEVSDVYVVSVVVKYKAEQLGNGLDSRKCYSSH